MKSFNTLLTTILVLIQSAICFGQTNTPRTTGVYVTTTNGTLLLVVTNRTSWQTALGILSTNNADARYMPYGAGNDIGDVWTWNGSIWTPAASQGIGTNTSTGGVYSITFIAPLTGGTITTQGNVSISQVSSNVNGYLGSNDFNTLMIKEPAIGDGASNQFWFNGKAWKVVDWTNVTSKPTVFTPDTHTHSEYLTNEIDDVFTNTAAFLVTSNNWTNWNTAFGWGNHATNGYLTTWDETDPVATAHILWPVTMLMTNKWGTGYNHSTSNGNPHSTQITNITGLRGDLDSRSLTNHTQAISTITDLQTSLDGKYDKTGGLISGNVIMQTSAMLAFSNNVGTKIILYDMGNYGRTNYELSISSATFEYKIPKAVAAGGVTRHRFSANEHTLADILYGDNETSYFIVYGGIRSTANGYTFPDSTVQTTAGLPLTGTASNSIALNSHPDTYFSIDGHTHSYLPLDGVATNAHRLDGYHAATSFASNAVPVLDASGVLYLSGLSAQEWVSTASIKANSNISFSTWTVTSAPNVTVYYPGVGNEQVLDAYNHSHPLITSGDTNTWYTAYSPTNHTHNYLPLTGTASNSIALDGHAASYFSIDGHTHNYLPLAGTASNSIALNGHADSYFSVTNHSHDYLPLHGKADDSDALDGYQPSTNGTANTIALRDPNGDSRFRYLFSDIIQPGQFKGNVIASSWNPAVAPTWTMHVENEGDFAFYTERNHHTYAPEPVVALGGAGQFYWNDKTWKLIDWTNIVSTPSTYPPSSHTHDYMANIAGGAEEDILMWDGANWYASDAYISSIATSGGLKTTGGRYPTLSITNGSSTDHYLRWSGTAWYPSTVSATIGSMADGSATSPGLAFEDDPDTGIYRYADNTLSIASTGTNVLDVTRAAGWSQLKLTGDGEVATVNELRLTSGTGRIQLGTTTTEVGIGTAIESGFGLVVNGDIKTQAGSYWQGTYQGQTTNLTVITGLTLQKDLNGFVTNITTTTATLNFVGGILVPE